MKVKKILIIDEDVNFQKELSSYLKSLKYTVSFTQADSLAKIYNENDLPDLLLVNPLVPEITVEQFLEKIKYYFKEIPIIIIANQRNYDVIVKSLHFGVIDYITKPTNAREIQIMSHHISSQSSLALLIKTTSDLYLNLVDTYEQQQKFSIISGSQEMMKVIEMMSIAAVQDDSNVIILGEIGVGKEAVARGIHSLSKRKNSVFLKFNCSSVSSILFESELYGQLLNAFTGMVENKTGVLEAANGGIIYLEELSEMPFYIQEKLVHTIQTGKFKRMQSTKTISLDVRFISSSHKKILKMVEDHTFSLELFELLNGYQIEILPLRERKDDIILLAKHFITMYSEILQRTQPELSHDALLSLLTYPFLKNERELQNMISKAMTLCDKNVDILRKEDFPELYVKGQQAEPDTIWLESFQPLEILEEKEKQWIINALKFYHNNKTHVAKALNITRQSLNRRIEKYKIDDESK